MKKSTVTILALAAFLSAANAAYAENTAEEEAAEIQIEETAEEKPPSRYFKHMSEFGPVEGEKINTDRSAYVFYLDSDNMSADMHAEIMPANATDKKLSFASSDESVVTVSEDGVLSASNRPGKATIFISGGAQYKEVKVEVRRAVTGITLSASDLSFYADQPTSAQLTANVIPADATDQNVTWRSSDTAVAGVDENGNVTTCGVGTATITAVTEDGGFKASCTIRSTVYNITVKGVFITNPIAELPIGTDYDLTASIYPESARNRSLTWSTSDANVVDIDGGGRIHANSEGYATITVNADGGHEDYFTIAAVPLTDGGEFRYSYTGEPLADRIASLAMPVHYNSYNTSYSSALSIQLRQSPVVFGTNSRSASQSEVEQYLDPENSTTGSARYQFLDLSRVSDVSARMLNVYLSDKGIFKGKGEVFRKAAEDNSVNAAYLAIHSCLETGGGTSKLSCGVDYEGTTVYNLFGIGAYDADPIGGGAKYAYEHGWTSIDAAIEGGAAWISRNYISSGQNTLYKMRWNPSRPGTNQYATDVAWAAKQAKTLQTFMDVFPINQLSFDVPVYAGSAEPAIRYE